MDPTREDMVKDKLSTTYFCFEPVHNNFQEGNSKLLNSSDSVLKAAGGIFEFEISESNSHVQMANTPPVAERVQVHQYSSKKVC